jgi:hypothetical protein
LDRQLERDSSVTLDLSSILGVLIIFTHTDGGSKVGMHQLNQIWRGRERDKTVKLVMVDNKNHVVSPVPQTYNLGIVGTPPIEIVIWGMVYGSITTTCNQPKLFKPCTDRNGKCTIGVTALR